MKMEEAMSGKKNYPKIPNLKNGRSKERRGAAIAWFAKLSVAAASSLTSSIPAMVAAVGLIGIGGTSAIMHLQQAPVKKEVPTGAPQVAMASGDVFRKTVSAENGSLSFATEANEGIIHFKGDGTYRDALNKKNSASDSSSSSASSADDLNKEDDQSEEASQEEDVQSKLAQQAKAKFQNSGINLKKIGSLNSLTASAGAGSSFSGGNVLGGSPFGKGAFGRNLEAPRALQKAERRKQTLGRLRPGPRQQHNRASRSMDRGYTSKSMGQLKLANVLSYDASRAMSDNKSSQLASDAFDQQRSNGGGDGFHNTGGAGLNEPVVPMGDGAPDLTDNESDKFGDDNLPTAPNFNGQNQTPYDGQMENIQSTAKKSRKNNILGTVLSIIGASLTLIGFALMAIFDPTGNTYTVGQWLVVIGMAFSLAGMLTSALGNDQKDDAKNQSANLGTQNGQQDQAAIADQYVEDTYEGESFNPDTETMPENDVHESVTAQQNATYDGVE
jgi:hypothetical protein